MLKMNREIKFRGKRVDNNEWVYGYLVFSEDYIFDYSCRIDIPYIIPIDNFNLKNYREYRVDESTIGQYTGLKDKNGVEIYEDDILNNTAVNFKFIVKFEKTKYVLQKLEYQEDLLNMYDFFNRIPNMFEVIGNIYESEEVNE